MLSGWDTGSGTLLDALLADQGDLSAVERFAQFHEAASTPLQGHYYRSLLPATAPGPGQQLGFEVDLDACSGCKACVVACHALNGLDDAESWRDVGLIVGGSRSLPVLQHVTSACHHCLDPACLSACPVDAYEKDPITGIVKHLDDQCFGCQYCTLACPYDVPKFHKGKGIVRKCDMCADRLGAGEAPACVQACPHEAIRIRVVDIEEVALRAEAGIFLATAPDPRLTRPTTRYLSTRDLGPDARSADGHRDHPEHAHPPLVVMLVLTQLAVGAFVVDLLLRLAGIPSPTILLAIGLVFGHVGIAASTAHLGRPHLAYRALIGLRHSWLSREIAAFGAFSMFATIHTATATLRPGGYGAHPILSLAMSFMSVVTGLAGVGCSVMVYHVTRRAFWGARLSGAKFAGTVALLGASALLVATSWGSPEGRMLGAASVLAVVAITLTMLRNETALLAHPDELLGRSARLLKGPLGRPWRWRRGLACVGGLLLPMIWLGAGPPMIPGVRAGAAVLSLGLLIASELVERFLFFAAVVRPKMPGGTTR